MIEKISSVKTKVLEFMDQEVGKYGNSRMDVKQIGELSDIVKDLAEAEYYCTVAQSMGGSQESFGYQGSMGYGGGQGSGGGSMGYGGQGGSGGGGGGRSGYGGSMGHTDTIQMIRDALSKADPELRAMIRTELMR